MRIPIPACVLLLAVAALWCEPSRSSEDPPPNIILILIDTLRADYLGAYGFQGDISPNLDRLAGESILFERCVAQAPWTKPSVATLMTSLHPLTHRVLDHDGKYWRRVGGENESSALPDSAFTLAEGLSEAGYLTAAWSGSYWITRTLGFDQGFEHFHEPPQANKNILDADRLLRPAMDWIGEWDETRPFFLYIHLMDVHTPWEWNEPDWLAISGSPSLGADRPMSQKEAQRLIPQIRNREDQFPRDIPPSLRVWRAVYASGVRDVDRKLGAFLDYLKTSGRLDDTLLVVTSDHGEELLEHGRWGHGRSLHGHQTRVPLIIRLPGSEQSGRRVEEVMSLTDVMPTLLAAGGVDSLPRGLQGTDLWDALLEAGVPPGPGLGFSGAVIGKPKMVSVFDGSHRLVWLFPDGTMRLYDQAADPTEQKNVQSEQVAIRDRLARDLTSRMTELLSTPSLLETTGELSEEELEKLKSLGYVQ